MKPPWDDCKVAFGIDDDDAIWCALGSSTGATLRVRLPRGWELVETDGTGARYVAVFRVKGTPTVAAGRVVKRLLRRAEKLAKP